jgi:hypothetical protein
VTFYDFITVGWPQKCQEVVGGYIIAFYWRFLLTIRDKGQEGLFFRVGVNSIAEKPAG